MSDHPFLQNIVLGLNGLAPVWDPVMDDLERTYYVFSIRSLAFRRIVFELDLESFHDISLYGLVLTLGCESDKERQSYNTVRLGSAVFDHVFQILRRRAGLADHALPLRPPPRLLDFMNVQRVDLTTVEAAP